MEILALVNEAMSLLPAQRRWDISFSTYYTKLPPGVDCVWRFVLQGSPEAQVASRLPGATVIDLCRPLGRAVGGPLVEAARTGQLPAPPEKPALVQAAVEASKQSVSVKGESTGKGRRDATGIRPVVPLQLVADEYGLGPPPTPRAHDLPHLPVTSWQPKKKRRSRWPWIASAVATILILGSGAGVLVWTGGPWLTALLNGSGLDKPAAKGPTKSLASNCALLGNTRRRNPLQMLNPPARSHRRRPPELMGIMCQDR